MYKIQEMMMAKDKDLFVNMVMNDPEHIRRSKEKAERYNIQREITLNEIMCKAVNEEVKKATENVMKCEHPNVRKLKSAAMTFGIVSVGWLMSVSVLL